MTSLSPASGTIGAEVTITGSGFAGATGVRFNTAASEFSVNSASKITATVPLAGQVHQRRRPAAPHVGAREQYRRRLTGQRLVGVDLDRHDGAPGRGRRVRGLCVGLCQPWPHTVTVAIPTAACADVVGIFPGRDAIIRLSRPGQFYGHSRNCGVFGLSVLPV